MKEPNGGVEYIDAAPRTGQYKIESDGSLTFRRPAMDWHGLQDESEIFFLRVYGPGDYRFKGADLGCLVTKGRMQTDDPAALTPRCLSLIAGIRQMFVSHPLEPLPTVLPLISLGASGL